MVGCRHKPHLRMAAKVAPSFLGKRLRSGDRSERIGPPATQLNRPGGDHYGDWLGAAKKSGLTAPPALCPVVAARAAPARQFAMVSQSRRVLAALGKDFALMAPRFDRLERSARDLLEKLAETTDEGAAWSRLATHGRPDCWWHGGLMPIILGGLPRSSANLSSPAKAQATSAKPRSIMLRL